MSVAAAEALVLAREKSRKAADSTDQARSADESAEPTPPEPTPPEGDNR